MSILQKAFVVEVAAPGMNKEDFHIEVKDNVLTIKIKQVLYINSNINLIDFDFLF